METRPRETKKAPPTERRPMKGERRVRVEGESWSFRIGRGSAVIVSPVGHKSIVTLSKLTGRSPDTLERGQWKGTSDGMVAPEHIREYIRGHRSELFQPARPR